MKNDSPCIGLCDSLYLDKCSGCGRTFVEQNNWLSMTDEEKSKVWARIETEKTALRFTTYSERAK